MRPSKVVRAVNWHYALGEVLLIVVGILVALAIADWNDRRLKREQELALLEEIRFELAADLASLEANRETFVAVDRQIGELQELFENPRPYDPSMDALFGSIYGFRMTNLHSTAYETLKSVGLQSVSSPELRVGLATVFDHYYELLIGGHEIEQEITLGVLRPYYLEHFRDLRIWESATPLDYDAVINDAYYHNIVAYRRTNLRTNQIDSYALAIDVIRDVLELIDQEL